MRVTRVAVLSSHTQTSYAPDLTAPVHTGPSAKPAPLSRWARLWARLRKGLGRPVAVPQPVEEGWEGTLVEFLGWEGSGESRRVLYNPFPTDPDRAIDYDKPLVLLLDRKVGESSRIWVTSAVSMVGCNVEGLPVRVDTRSSSYSIHWLDKPAPLPEDDGRVRG